MRKDDNGWAIVYRTQEEHQVQIDGSEYEVDADTAAICHAILLLVDGINDKGFCHDREMDSRCDKAQRRSQRDARREEGRENF